MNFEISINTIETYNGKYYGVTTNNNTGEETIWDNVVLQFKVDPNGCGQINGIGRSIFRDTTIPFIIVGEFNSYLKHITFRKVHISRKVKNVISYTGKLELYMDKFTISINSDLANGQITNNYLENNNSEFKGNIFKLTTPKKLKFGCF